VRAHRAIILDRAMMESPATSVPAAELARLRANFPVLAEHAYLNAGTDGPLPAAAVEAAAAEAERALREGRTGAHFERRRELQDELRAAYAGLLSCAPEDLALTTCTSEGLHLVLSGLELGASDEILTSDEEHPGLLGALQAASELHGVAIRVVELEQLASAVSPRTRLVACSHVSWVSGALPPAQLAELPEEVTVVLDGAQGVGAVPVDVRALGADAYAGAGQKWLCGPDGVGMLYVSPQLRERVRVSRRGYLNLANPDGGLDARLQPDARRFDAFALSAETLACAIAALRVLEAPGWEHVHERARSLATRLASALEEAGRAVRRRGASTLVSFAARDPASARGHLAERGVIVRDIPGHDLLRASVGAWNDESDLARLLDALGSPA
jgi:selenocysteine lyase/cysteine desulfurase